MAAGPWAAGRRPGRWRLAQLHRGAMGAYPWCLRPWLRLSARGGRCAHPAGDAHPLGHSETAGRLPPGPPPAGAIAAGVTRQCRRAQGCMGRGRAALAGSPRPAPTPQGPRAQAVPPVIGGLGAWRCPGGRRSPGPVHGRPCGHGMLVVKNALGALGCCADCYVLRSACPPAQVAGRRAAGQAWPTATARAYRPCTAPTPRGGACAPRWQGSAAAGTQGPPGAPRGWPWCPPGA